MINEENKTEQIDRYLDDEMMPAERAVFEERLRREEELRLEVIAQKAVKSYVQQKGEEAELKKMFDGFHREITPQEEIQNEPSQVKEDNEKVRKLNWGGVSYAAIAASVALIIVSVWLVIKQDDRIEPGVEIRNNLDKQPFQIPLLVWETKNDVRVKKETLTKYAVIIKDAAHPMHYRFTDTFELYLNAIPKSRPAISLEYDSNRRSYKVWIAGHSYAIQQTDKITPLK